MQVVSQEINSYFTSLVEFTSIMDDRLFPLVALEDTSFPFCIYKIEQQRGMSKDADTFDISLYAYFKAENYKEATQFNDVIREKLDESKYQYQDSSIDFIEDNNSIVLVLTFKKG